MRRTPVDPNAVSRGAEVFQASACAECHGGPLFTSNFLEDVGTGGDRQVPSLIGVGTRGPWMSSGCAKTMAERFDPDCGGAAHGDPVDAAHVNDIVAYLETL